MLGSLIAAIASGEGKAMLCRARSAAIAYLVAGLLGLCGAVFLIAALFVWAARRLGTVEAALILGIAFLAAAGIVLAIHAIARRGRTRRARRQRDGEFAAMATASAIAALPALLRSRPGPGAVILPLGALAAFAIWRENSKRGGGPTRG